MTIEKMMSDLQKDLENIQKNDYVVAIAQLHDLLRHTLNTSAMHAYEAELDHEFLNHQFKYLVTVNQLMHDYKIRQ